VNWKIEEEHKIEEVVEIEEVDENCSKLQNCGGGFGSIFGRNFGSVFEVHFGVHFGLFLDSDLLVLRGFLSVEGGFGPFSDVFWTVHLPPFSPALEPYSSALACWSTTRTRAVRGSCTPHSQVLYVAGFSVRDKLASPAIASSYSWFSAHKS
jgi:hypothetical protein